MLVSSRTTNILLVLVLVVGIGIVAMLASGVRGGPLDPPGPPASTMHTLADTPPSWDQVLDSTNGAPGPNPPAGCNSDRFKCVMSTTPQCDPPCATVYPAVLDEETGLVWQRSPDAFTSDWHTANDVCWGSHVGGRGGWRLPTAAEIGSLKAGDGPPFGPPAGHPFNIPPDQAYWTSTDDVDRSTLAIYSSLESPGFGLGAKVNLEYTWCVRGATSNR